MTAFASIAKPGDHFMRYEIRARSFGEILDGAFQLYRNHLKVFLGITALFSFPAWILIDLIGWYAGISAVGANDKVPPEAAAKMVGAFLVSMPLLFAAFIAQSGAITVAISDAYLGKSVDIGGTIRRSMPFFGRIAGASILIGIFGMLWCLLLVIPGLVYFFRRSLYVQTITVEDHEVGEALKRSRAMVKGAGGRLVAFMLIVGSLGVVFQLGLKAVVPHAVASIPVLGEVILQLPQLVLGPLGPIIATLFYFDQRVRKEGFDLEVLSRELGAGGQAVA
jgi:hypothetical protein